MMSYKRVTIFGGSGFIGRYIVDRAADLDWTIRVPSRRPASAYALRTSGHVGQVVPEECNIMNDHDIERVVTGSDCVINLIGILAERRRGDFERIHADFPERLAKIAKRSGVERLIHISALGASKDSPAHYQQTKYAGEQALLKEFPTATVLQPSIVFGPQDQFFNRFAHMALISPVLPLIGGGKTKFQPVYVGDVADAVISCMTAKGEIRKRQQGQIYQLGGPEVKTFKELMQQMLDIIPLKRYLIGVPWGVAKLKGRFLQHLPGKLLTVDQVKSLKSDNIVSESAKTLSDLGIVATPLHTILPDYLVQYRTGGQYADLAKR